jgi:hypothetical protein
MKGVYRWDDAVLAAIQRGVATRTAIKREVQIPHCSLLVSLSRLSANGKIKQFQKGWYVPCE